MLIKDSISQEIDGIVNTYRDSILRLSYAYLKDIHEAEDVAQEVFVAYIKSAPAIKNEQKRKAWLLKVTANKCKNLLASARLKNNVELKDELFYLPEDDLNVIEYVYALKEKYRIPIHLYYYEGYSIAEIAKLLDVPPATVGTRLSRARKLLKTALGDDYNE